MPHWGYRDKGTKVKKLKIENKIIENEKMIIQFLEEKNI